MAKSAPVGHDSASCPIPGEELSPASYLQLLVNFSSALLSSPQWEIAKNPRRSLLHEVLPLTGCFCHI